MATIGEVLRGTQADLMTRGGHPERLAQPGGACLAGPFPLRVPVAGDPVYPTDGAPIIEMFMVGPDGSVEATGADPAVGDWWRPEVEALVERVRDALARIGVALAQPVHVTASATPVGAVVTDAHLDDDQPNPADGVGVVAIAASHGGPRLAITPMACLPIAPPAPIALAAGVVEDFDLPHDARLGGSTDDDVQETPADRIVVFARFGQLHAGPRLTGVDPGEVRNLLVLRAGTVPRSAEEGRNGQARRGSGPT